MRLLGDPAVDEPSRGGIRRQLPGDEEKIAGAHRVAVRRRGGGGGAPGTIRNSRSMALTGWARAGGVSRRRVA